MSIESDMANIQEGAKIYRSGLSPHAKNTKDHFKSIVGEDGGRGWQYAFPDVHAALQAAFRQVRDAIADGQASKLHADAQAAHEHFLVAAGDGGVSGERLSGVLGASKNVRAQAEDVSDLAQKTIDWVNEAERRIGETLTDTLGMVVVAAGTTAQYAETVEYQAEHTADLAGAYVRQQTLNESDT